MCRLSRRSAVITCVSKLPQWKAPWHGLCSHSESPAIEPPFEGLALLPAVCLLTWPVLCLAMTLHNAALSPPLSSPGLAGWKGSTRALLLDSIVRQAAVAEPASQVGKLASRLCVFACFAPEPSQPLTFYCCCCNEFLALFATIRSSHLRSHDGPRSGSRFCVAQAWLHPFSTRYCPLQLS